MNYSEQVMDSSSVCPTEDAVHALMGHLVAPLLPLKSNSMPDLPPSLSHSVAQQMSAVVLLYNYYHRKGHPQLEFLGFESFCRLSVVLKPALIAHMMIAKTHSGDTKTDITEIQLSATEKAVMNTCNICQSLDASVAMPNIEGWPISKVSVFLVDSKKENCLLYFGSVTQGVWSIVEKEIDCGGDGTVGAVETKYINKRKRIIKKAPRADIFLDDSVYQQLAFSAIKDATGVSQSDLSILENHIVYSGSKEKATTSFYIMRCTNPMSDNVIQVPIEDVINSLKGPLFTDGSCGWTITPVVEYFHLLPYSDILRRWFTKVDLPQSKEMQMLETGNMGKNLFEAVNHGDPEKERNGGIMPKDKLPLVKKAFSGGDDDSHSKGIPAVDFHMNIFTRSVEPKDTHDDRRLPLFSPSPDPPDVDDLGKQITRVEVDTANRTPDRGGRGPFFPPMAIEDDPFRGSGSGGTLLPAGKGNSLSQLALRVLFRKKDKLCLQRRVIDEEIDQCDRTIRAVLTGGEEELTLKLESIIECCSAQLLD